MTLGSTGEFLTILEHSKLLSPETFVEVQSLARDTADSTELAKALVRKGILTRWQAGQLLAGRSKCTVGKYKLLELLGRGGMGSVYLGEHVMMNRRVAIKIIPRHIGKDPAGLERFLSEARTIASLDHPNIVQAYSVDNEGDQYYLVMEYVDGLDLNRLVEAEGPLDCASAVDYIRQAAEGLSHAHARNMVHCDIKPSNLIVNPQGVVKILDLGLVRLAGKGEGDAANEPDERILGSVDFMAPEQALNSADFDHRADIYALGCTLYFLLTGHAPFPEGTLPERILKHQTQEPQSISSQRSDVPLSLIDICKKMMSKRPANRFQTAADVSQILSSWRPGEKHAQRILQLKKAEPIDELPGAELLGTDLSQLFSKDIGAAPRAPILVRKPPERGDNQPATFRPLFGTPPRIIMTLIVSAATVSVVAVGLALFFSNAHYYFTSTSNNNTVGPANKIDNGSKTNNPSNPASNNQTQINPQSLSGQQGIAPPPIEHVGDANNSGSATSATQQDTIPPEHSLPVQIEPEQPQIKSFGDLAADVSLPDINKDQGDNGADKTASFGKVVLPPGVNLGLALIGGNQSMKNAESLVLAPERYSPAWRIYAETVSKTGNGFSQQTGIAQLKLNADDLVFSWVPHVSPAYADALKYCGILATAQGQRQFVQLCRPRPANPLALDLDTGTVKTSLQLDPSLAEGAVYVQISEREGALPPNALQPSDTLENVTEDESELNLVFTDEKYANFRVKITAQIAAQKLELKAVALYEAPGMQVQTFKSKVALSLLNDLMRRQPTIEASFKRAQPGSAQKKKAGETLELLNNQIAFLKSLNELYQSLNGKCKIHYRVFIPEGKYKVELYRTQPSSAKPADANLTVSGK